MKNIVTTTSVFPCCADVAQLAYRLGAIGYKALDLAFDYCVQKPDYPFMTDAYEDWARDLRRRADAIGVRYTHSHAPFDARYRGPLIGKTMRVCEILGIHYCVVHPIWQDENKNIITDREQFIHVNADAIRPLLPTAQAHNVVLLSENLLWGASIEVGIISDLVKEVNSPWFGWCHDTGHAKGCDRSPADLAGCIPPLSLHIQDSTSGRDGHLLPGDGDIDWKFLLDMLKQIGYAGDVVLEAHHQSLDAPDVERDALLVDLLHRAEKIRGYMEK